MEEIKELIEALARKVVDKEMSLPRVGLELRIAVVRETLKKGGSYSQCAKRVCVTKGAIDRYRKMYDVE